MYSKNSFSSNAELTKYAKDKYNLDLDGRAPMEKLLDQLNDAQNNNVGLQSDGNKPDIKPDTKPDEMPDNQTNEEQDLQSNDKKAINYLSDPVGKGLALLRSRKGA